MGLNFFPEKKEKISNALSMAEQIVGNEPINDINSAVNLLKKNGVSPEFLDNVEKMAEHPVAKTLFSFAGMNKENVLKDLNMLKNGYNTATNSNSTQYGSRRVLPKKDELAVFRSGLKQFKK